MRDKRLVFDEMRRQRRAWKSSGNEVSVRWLVAFVVLFLLAGLMDAHRAAKEWAPHQSLSQGHEGQPWGGRHGAKSK